eukprot:s635_g22.t1
MFFNANLTLEFWWLRNVNGFEWFNSKLKVAPWSCHFPGVLRRILTGHLKDLH